MQSNKAKTFPTKQFFVSMLTRDIGLIDAILDLIDNCMDGALRSSSHGIVDYGKYNINISVSSTQFVIEDNCGGIPRDVAQNYAFRMGQEIDDKRDAKNEMIGMYGIGMKRAIFKMGENAIVSTRHDQDSYCVKITPEWLSDKDWNDFELLSAEEPWNEPGTKITINHLYPVTSIHFSNAAFMNDLIAAIGGRFTAFIQKGIKIFINGDLVQPIPIKILMSDSPGGPVPFIYKKKIKNVMVTIAVGLNTGNPFDEDDEEDFERNRSSAIAGWTVFCNDRAVIVGDKSRITGWGDGVPLYHGQFSVITGIVEFRSENAEELPITTTKRTLDISSEIWLEARAKMREGLRVWINYTNSWKNHPREDQAPFWKESQALSLPEISEKVSSNLIAMTAKNDGAAEFNPEKKKCLPLPKGQKPFSRKIVFSRPFNEIAKISAFFFDRDDETPGIVGEKCFQHILDNMEK